jgi:DNA-directed RNA polymerase sigma subunit (sigma70/sigma32)
MPAIGALEELWQRVDRLEEEVEARLRSQPIDAVLASAMQQIHDQLEDINRIEARNAELEAKVHDQEHLIDALQADLRQERGMHDSTKTTLASNQAYSTQLADRLRRIGEALKP